MRGRRLRRRKRIGARRECQRGKNAAWARSAQLLRDRVCKRPARRHVRANPTLTMKLSINGNAVEVRAAADTPLLWVLRDELGLTGTKFGCGLGLCGACTVHLNGEPVRSCQTPVGAIGVKNITTIEGLASGGKLSAVQQAWIEEDVVQCGYCQSGQIMSATALLKKNARPTDAQIDDAMAGNICRCGTYEKIRAGVHRAADLAAAGATGSPPASGVKKGGA